MRSQRSQRRLWNSEWRSLIVGVLLTCLLAVMAIGMPHASAETGQPQTVPSPTPQTVPDPVTPEPNNTSLPPGQTAPPQPQGQGLLLQQTVSRTDVLPGEKVTLGLRATNSSSQAMLSLILVAPLDARLRPLAVSGIQGSVERQGEALSIHLGTLEAGQSAEITVRVAIGPETPPGHIFVHQFHAFYLEGEAFSNAVAFGLPPEELPPTGKSGRAP